MRKSQITFGDRLMSVLLSIVFSVPTAILVWFGLNFELTFHFDVFISSKYLWGSVVVFSIIAFVAPDLFTSIISNIWKGIMKVGRWWGW